MTYLSHLEEFYLKQADNERAVQMARYMKNQFEFFGLPSPIRKEIEKEFLSQFGKPAVKELPALIKESYKKPQREFQYFIIGLTCEYIKQLPEDFIKTAHYMVITKSWWDSVDWIAAWIVGGLVKPRLCIRKVK